MSVLAQPPLSVRIHHKFRKIWSFCAWKCGSSHLKNPSPLVRTGQTPPPDCGRLLWTALNYYQRQLLEGKRWRKIKQNTNPPRVATGSTFTAKFTPENLPDTGRATRGIGRGGTPECGPEWDPECGPEVKCRGNKYDECCWKGITHHILKRITHPGKAQIYRTVGINYTCSKTRLTENVFLLIPAVP